jgi:hypothetical protein
LLEFPGDKIISDKMGDAGTMMLALRLTTRRFLTPHAGKPRG